MLLHACKHYIKLIVVRIRISSYSTAQLQHLTPTHANYTFPLDTRSYYTQLDLSIKGFSLKVTLHLVYSKDFLKTIRYKAYHHCTVCMYVRIVYSNFDHNHAIDIWYPALLC